MTIEKEDFLQGKTIVEAGIAKDGADSVFVMRFADGSSATVSAWQREGYPVEMIVEATVPST